MESQEIYSICGMCTVRCPIQATVAGGQVRMLQGNPHASGMEGSLCARGAAGLALVNDSERPQTPLIRTGERGEGKWRRATWDEALDYVAERLKTLMEKHGPQTVALSDRGGPFRDYRRAFLRGLGTPNYCNHDASCARNIHHAHLSLTGLGRKDVSYDFKNARHVVLQFRNIFEAVAVQEVNNLMSAMENGCGLTVIDIRANVSAYKAGRYLMIRPGADYAFNLAVIREILERRAYDQDFAQRFIPDIGRLRTFVEPYTPEWAEAQTGIPAHQLHALVRDLTAAAPAVIWHPGWMAARYKDSFYVCRTIYIINALLGAHGSKGGLPLVNGPAAVGAKGLKKFMDLYPKPKEKRADGVGWRYPQFETGPGLAHLLYKAMDTDDPYPVKAYIAYRHDPLMGFPDPDRLQQIFAKLDLLVSVTFSWSDTAWFSDVVLPLSTYLERDSIMACKNGVKPYFFMRRQALKPRYDSLAGWEIISGLARRLGLEDLVFERIEDIWNFQLKDTGVSIADFDATGMVPLTDKPIYKSRDEIRFKTPSGKVEIFSDKLKEWGIESLKPYSAPPPPPAGQFRLTFGRCAVHTQGHTVNNPMLFEQMPENVLWIHTGAAASLGIRDGDLVSVSQDGYSERIRAKVTETIHPEAVFVLHGFGHRLPVETRAFGRGLADNRFMKGGLEIWDQAGGAVAYQEHFVSVSKV